MPKQFKKYLRFDGGLNTNADPRDIGEHELSDIKNMMVDHVGKIRTIGQLGDPAGSDWDASINAEPGYGLFVFGSDYDLGSPKTVSIVSDQGGNAGYQTSAAHGYSADDLVYHYGFSNSSYNGAKKVHGILSPTVYTADDLSSGDNDSYISNDSGNSLPESSISLYPTQVLVLVDSSTGDVYLKLNDSGSWANEFFNIGSSSGIKAVFYVIDGALRVSDANFGTNNEVKWLGYFIRRHFTSAKGDNFNGWFPFNAELDAPTAGLVALNVASIADADATNVQLKDDGVLQDWSIAGTENYVAVSETDGQARDITAQGAGPDYELTTDALTGTWASDSYSLCPPTGEGFNIAINSSASTGTWAADEIEFASSFVYDGDQESLLFTMMGSFTPTVDKAVNIRILGTKSYSARIKGGRIYYRLKDSTDEWKLLVDIDMAQGVRGSLEDSYLGWEYLGDTAGSGDAPNNAYFDGDFITTYDPPVLSYEALTGVKQDELTIAAKFKAATVLNRRAWIANIAKDDVDGTETYFGDRIMFSPVNQFDVFPASFYLALGLNDGDEFIALEGYADRLFAFKRKRLFVVNVAQGSSQGWFVESQHEHLGVEHPAAVFKTDLGLIWANDAGCFFFNGSQITNLIEKQGQRMISYSDWSGFITKNTVVGFEPLRRQIIVLGDADGATGTVYIFDMATLSWAKGDKFSQAADGEYTNFAIRARDAYDSSYPTELLIGKYTS